MVHEGPFAAVLDWNVGEIPEPECWRHAKAGREESVEEMGLAAIRQMKARVKVKESGRGRHYPHDCCFRDPPVGMTRPHQ